MITNVNSVKVVSSTSISSLPQLSKHEQRMNTTTASKKKQQQHKTKKKMTEKYQQQQKQQQNQYNTLIYRIMIGYCSIVTTVVLIYMISSPQQISKLLWSSSLARFNQQQVIKVVIPEQHKNKKMLKKNPKQDYTKGNRSNNNNYRKDDSDEQQGFVEVGQSVTKEYQQRQQYSKPTSLKIIKQQQPMKPQKHFQFQKGVVQGVAFFQCCTIHGFTDAFDARYNDKKYINGMPRGNLIMPSMLYSNDMIILGHEYFQQRSIQIFEDMPMGGSVPISDTEREHRAMYEYCIAAEEHHGLIDTIIVLDIEYNNHNTSIDNNNNNTTSISNTVQQLTNILQDLLVTKRISALPVAALVTPQETSQIIIDWILYDNYISLMKLVRHWIPISAGPYLLVQHKQVGISITNTDNTNNDISLVDDVPLLRSSSAFHNMNKWPILLISGTQDIVSQQAANILKKVQHDSKYNHNNRHIYTNITTVRGNVLFYINNPKDFVYTILQYFQEWDEKNPKSAGEIEDITKIDDYNFLEEIDPLCIFPTKEML